ncbi:MAG: HAMP domain-containing protein [Thermodesulfovibrionales bacterium]|jgi:nitrate/nitrite-specific signal transduction histidine kinase|nr:HAMP domain-containing protein [Thermodesulfovibrionales bacterium]
MKIKTKLQIIIIFTIVVFTTIILLNLWWQKQADLLNKKEELVRELSFFVFERAQVRDEYLMYGEKRSKVQWFLMHKKLQELLDKMSGIFTDKDEKAILNSFTGFHNKTGKLFEQLIRHDESIAGSDAASRELRERLVSQMMVSAHSQYLEGLKLQNIIGRKAEYQHELLHLYGNIAYGFLAVLIITFAVILIRAITHPLAKLQEGTKIIANGNLDYKVGTNAKDEIGQLSRAFDAMTENLKTITASRDELNREIEERKLAEQALERSNRELEQRLHEIKTLRGILPICSYCKKIRNDKGYWEQLEMYIHDHSEAEFSHGMCDDCAKKAMEEFEEFKKKD